MFSVSDEVLFRFQHVCQDSVLKNPRGLSVKQIATALGKDEGTIYGELNSNPRFKLGAFDLFRLMDLTGSIEPLHFQASHFGRQMHDSAADPNGHDMDEECLQGFQAVAKFIEMAKVGTDYETLHPFLVQAVKELEDVWKRRRDENMGVK